jgi:dolichol-phosphate mannosyltransferase
MLNNSNVLLVIPCYKVASFIEETVSGLPQWIDSIVLVNDFSPDETSAVLRKIASSNPKVVLLENARNMGVGGAMIAGFKYALTTNCDIVVKMDGDGQMNPKFLPALLNPFQDSSIHFTKGNRFNDFKALQKMPVVRRVGNMGLSFMIKAASGYWDIFDPTNGFFAISKNYLEKIDLDRLAHRYFFESSLLIELYYSGAAIKDIPMPAVYGDEESNLSVVKTLFGFPPKLLKALLRRIFLCYFIYDFNIASVYFLAGFPLFLFGLLFGVTEWLRFASHDISAPTGTVMLAVLPIVLGFQMILAAIQHDIQSKNPFRTE